MGQFIKVSLPAGVLIKMESLIIIAALVEL